jgi:hypothetical protein
LKKAQGAAQVHIIYTRETLDWKKEKKEQRNREHCSKNFHYKLWNIYFFQRLDVDRMISGFKKP